MAKFNNNETFFAALNKLIDNWCDRRCLKALSVVLPHSLAFSGLTDSWGDLCAALKIVRSVHRNDLTPDEIEVVSDLIATAEYALDRR
jgi:hypothetical protein